MRTRSSYTVLYRPAGGAVSKARSAHLVGFRLSFSEAPGRKLVGWAAGENTKQVKAAQTAPPVCGFPASFMSAEPSGDVCRFAQ